MENEKNEEFLKARKIERGSVIDHITAGRALKVLKVLGIDERFKGTVTVLMNVPSTSYGSKDLIKIEGRQLDKAEAQKIALLAPYATIVTVRDFQVIDKYRVSLPDVIEGVARCPNPNCLSASEGLSKFFTEERDPIKLRCAYCESVFGEAELL